MGDDISTPSGLKGDTAMSANFTNPTSLYCSTVHCSPRPEPLEGFLSRSDRKSAQIERFREKVRHRPENVSKLALCHKLLVFLSSWKIRSKTRFFCPQMIATEPLPF